MNSIPFERIKKGGHDQSLEIRVTVLKSIFLNDVVSASRKQTPARTQEEMVNVTIQLGGCVLSRAQSWREKAFFWDKIDACVTDLVNEGLHH